MQKITPFLWFDGQAEQAMKFYCSIFKDAKVLSVNRRENKVVTAVFRLQGQEFTALNSGPEFKFTPAISFVVHCQTQREVDGYWKKLLKGGKVMQCGWLTDKYGITWQIVPTVLIEMLWDKDPAKAERVWQAMIKMVKLDIKALQKAYKGSSRQRA